MADHIIKARLTGLPGRLARQIRKGGAAISVPSVPCPIDSSEGPVCSPAEIDKRNLGAEGIGIDEAALIVTILDQRHR